METGSLELEASHEIQLVDSIGCTIGRHMCNIYVAFVEFLYIKRIEDYYTSRHE